MTMDSLAKLKLGKLVFAFCHAARKATVEPTTDNRKDADGLMVKLIRAGYAPTNDTDSICLAMSEFPIDHTKALSYAERIVNSLLPLEDAHHNMREQWKRAGENVGPMLSPSEICKRIERQ